MMFFVSHYGLGTFRKISFASGAGRPYGTIPNPKPRLRRFANDILLKSCQSDATIQTENAHGK